MYKYIFRYIYLYNILTNDKRDPVEDPRLDRLQRIHAQDRIRRVGVLHNQEVGPVELVVGWIDEGARRRRGHHKLLMGVTSSKIRAYHWMNFGVRQK